MIRDKMKILWEVLYMKIIKNNEGIEGNNSDKCKTIEYSFDEKDIDLGELP